MWWFFKKTCLNCYRCNEREGYIIDLQNKEIVNNYYICSKAPKEDNILKNYNACALWEDRVSIP